MLSSEFFLHDHSYYAMLFKDEDFTERVISRYRELRRGILSNESLTATSTTRSVISRRRGTQF